MVAGRARLRCQIAEDDENRGQSYEMFGSAQRKWQKSLAQEQKKVKGKQTCAT